MKKVFQIITILLMAGGFISIGISIYKKTIQKSSANKLLVEGNFNLVGKDINNNNTKISSPTNTYIIYFSPTCDHCKYEIQEIVKNIHKLDQFQVYAISSDELDEIALFEKQNNTADKKIKFMQVDINQVFPAFGSLSVPQTIIYKNGKLLNYYKGEVKFSQIALSLNS